MFSVSYSPGKQHWLTALAFVGPPWIATSSQSFPQQSHLSGGPYLGIGSLKQKQRSALPDSWLRMGIPERVEILFWLNGKAGKVDGRKPYRAERKKSTASRRYIKTRNRYCSPEDSGTQRRNVDADQGWKRTQSSWLRTW